MEARFAQCAMVAATMLALSGCRSGTGSSSSGSGWNWGFGSKNSASASSTASTTPEKPQLPSAGATPSSGPALGNSRSAPGGYPEQTSPGSYATNPYAGQAMGYTNPATGGGAAAGASAGGYQPPQSAYSGASGAVTPQTGLYNESPNPASAAGGAYASTPYGGQQPPAGTGNSYQSAQGTADPTQAQSYAAGAGAYGNAGGQPNASAADAYRDSMSAMPPQAPGNPYANSPDPVAGNYQTADARSGDRYPTSAAQGEQAAADRYATAGAAGNAADATAGAPSGDRYQPGNTGYNPGQTGYAPPGVPPYQMPAQPNVVSTPRRDPYYRPGGTSDFVSGNTQTPPGGADRYAAPAGSPPGDPAAATSVYQSPTQPPLR